MRIGTIIAEKKGGEVVSLAAGRDIVGLKAMFKSFKGKKPKEYTEIYFFVSGRRDMRIRISRAIDPVPQAPVIGDNENESGGALPIRRRKRIA